MFCFKCGGKILDMSQFCNHCGTNLAMLHQQNVASTAAQPAQPLNNQAMQPQNTSKGGFLKNLLPTGAAALGGGILGSLLGAKSAAAETVNHGANTALDGVAHIAATQAMPVSETVASVNPETMIPQDLINNPTDYVEADVSHALDTLGGSDITGTLDLSDMPTGVLVHGTEILGEAADGISHFI